MSEKADDRPDDFEAAVQDGYASYGKNALRFYDLFVFYCNVPLFWRGSSRDLKELYGRSVGGKHLELGVGTGYLLARSRLAVEPVVTLADANAATLEHTARRLRFPTEKVVANALEPLPLPRESHDSAALNFLLHCIPGDLREKGVAIRNAAAVVRPGGVVFGSTLLSKGVPVTVGGRWLMNRLSSAGMLHNDRDSLDDLRDELAADFSRFELETHGSIAMFRALKDG